MREPPAYWAEPWGVSHSRARHFEYTHSSFELTRTMPAPSAVAAAAPCPFSSSAAALGTTLGHSGDTREFVPTLSLRDCQLQCNRSYPDNKCFRKAR